MVDTTHEQAAGGTTSWAPGLEPKKGTRYEIQEAVTLGDHEPPCWKPVGVVVAHSAKAAMREWYETNESDSTTPFTMRACPVRNITQLVVEFRTHTQLTFS